MAESFEGKIISNPLANLRPQKMQCSKAVGIRVIFNHCKRLRCWGMYTDTNKNQANDFTQDLLQKTHTPGFNGLTATKKAAHNTMMRLKMQQESQVLLYLE
jgi:hypothetical protein